MLGALSWMKSKFLLVIGAIVTIGGLLLKIRGDKYRREAEENQREAESAKTGGILSDTLLRSKYEYDQKVKERENERKKSIKSGKRDYFDNNDGGL